MSDQAVLWPNWFPHEWIILAKEQSGHSHIFWSMPIITFSPVSNFGDQSLDTYLWHCNNIKVRLSNYSSCFAYYNFRYGLSNCLFAATYDEILKNCNCVPFFHTMAYNDNPQICAGTSLFCMNKILRWKDISSMDVLLSDF